MQDQKQTFNVELQTLFPIEWIEKPGSILKNQVATAKKRSKYDPYVN